MNHALREYTESSVAGEGQLKLIIMLYEGAGRFLNQAKEQIRRKEIENAHNNLTKAKRIVTHFLCTNNPESGELAVNLHKLYVFLYEKIAMANMEKKEEHVDAALLILNKLLEGWKELQQQAGTAPAAYGQYSQHDALSFQA